MQRLLDWFKKAGINHLLQKTHFKYGDRLKIDGWKRIYYENMKHKIVEVVILISDTVDFKVMSGKTKRDTS